MDKELKHVYNRTEQINEVNLSTRYKPGQSGNPAGRPKNSVTTLLKNVDEITNQKICDKLIELALKGDLPAIREYLDRTDGKVPLPITGGDDPIRIEVIGLLGRLRGKNATK